MSYDLIAKTALIACLTSLPIAAEPISDSAFEAATSLKSLTPPPPEKSEQKAYALAIGNTLLPVALGAILIATDPDDETGALESGGILAYYGLWIGPSIGEFYAGATKQALLGIGGRCLGDGLITGGLVALYADSTNRMPSLGKALLFSGLIIYGASTVYSFIDTHFAVDRANEKTRSQHFGFSPELFPSSNGGLKPGMMAWAKF